MEKAIKTTVALDQKTRERIESIATERGTTTAATHRWLMARAVEWWDKMSATKKQSS